MKRLSTVFFVLASAASAAQEARKPLTYIINPWPVLEFHTESTGGTSLLSTNGSVETGAGHDARRLVLDKDDKVIFGYYIEARKTDLGECTIRIKPLEREKNVPTLAAAREFPQLNPGDEAQVDIFYNPRTGEKVYDVIRVASQRASKPEGEQFSLLRCRVDVNGKTIRGTSTFWMIGGALIISLPGRGDYYFGLAPCANTPCRPAAWVDHNVLRFHSNGDLVEVVAKANVLQQSAYRTLWMYHDPATKAREVDFTCGDDVDWLARDKKTQKD